MRVTNLLVLVLCLGVTGACGNPAVSISGVAGETRSLNHKHLGNILQTPYGDSLNIFCSANDSRNLTIQLDGRRIPGVTEVNMTTLQLTVEKPDIGVYYYTCIKEAYAVKLKVRVVPVVTVVSANVHHKRYRRTDNFFVPINEDYEVVCYGNPKLSINNRRDMGIISLNETAVKTKKFKGMEYSRRVYYCLNQASAQAASPNIEILFDYVPAATDFWCAEYDWQVNCSWRVMSADTTFTLFYSDADGNSMRIFEDFMGDKKTRCCEWSLKEVSEYGLAISNNISLVIQACNPIYCSNQTYTAVRKSIMKTGYPEYLEILNRTSSSAVVTWRGPNNMYYNEMPVEYKLVCRMRGVVLNESSQITCDHRSMRYLETCKGELSLPCPGAIYEVDVYSKFTSTPRTNEAYWSGPARITVWTNSQNSPDIVDPACLEEPDLIDNKYVAIYEVRKFERSFRKEQSAVQAKVKALKHKLNRIMKLCRELFLDGCERLVRT